MITLFGVNVLVVYTSFKVGNYFSLKCKTPFPLLSNVVVYEFTCQRDADITYIGKTKRHLITRAQEHLALQESSQKSEVKTHILSCSTCKGGSLNVDKFRVKKRCVNSFAVLIHEALLITRFSPKLNKQLFTKGSFYTLKVF